MSNFAMFVVPFWTFPSLAILSVAFATGLAIYQVGYNG